MINKALCLEDDVLNIDTRTLNIVMKLIISNEGIDVKRGISYRAKIIFTSSKNVDKSTSFGSEDDSTNSEYIDIERDISSYSDGMSTCSHRRDVQRHILTLPSPASARYEDIETKEIH